MPAAVMPQDIDEAFVAIHRHVRATPVLELEPGILSVSAGTVMAKLEFLQHSGSFKARGAFTNLLLRDVPDAGVVAASGGNHGAAVAYAASRLGIPARIFVPAISSQAKQDRIRELGAELVVGGDLYADALAASKEWIDRSGALEIHAYDQLETLMGQGTVGLEFERQCPDLDTILVSVGGGGLIGGITAWFEGRKKIVGVEPEAAPTLTRALEAGKPVDAPAGGIAADSLAPKQVGALMFPIFQAHGGGTVTVSDEAILEAQARVWRDFRIVLEPGAATAVAALTSGAYTPQPNERVGVLLCGANSTAVSFDR